MKPTISVIVPVYNVATYIRKCLDSIVTQTYTNFEVILINNSSTDRSGEICDEYAQKDKRIRVIHKKNEGVGVSRNLGIHEAKGEWISFIDSDDWVEPDYLENLIVYTSGERPDIVFSGGFVEERSTEQKTVRHFDKTFEANTPEFRRLLISKMLAVNTYKDRMQNGVNLGTVWGKLYKTDTLHANNLFFLIHIEPGMDTLFNMKALNVAELVYCCPYVGYHYRYSVPTGAMCRFHPEVVQTSYDYISTLWEYNKENDIKVNDDILYTRSLIMIMQSFKTYFFHPDNSISWTQKEKEICEYKRKPLVYRTIFRKSNSILTCKQLIFKYMLRLPGAKAISFLYSSYYKISQIGVKLPQ